MKVFILLSLLSANPEVLATFHSYKSCNDAIRAAVKHHLVQSTGKVDEKIINLVLDEYMDKQQDFKCLETTQVKG